MLHTKGAKNYFAQFTKGANIMLNLIINKFLRNIMESIFDLNKKQIETLNKLAKRKNAIPPTNLKVEQGKISLTSYPIKVSFNTSMENGIIPLEILSYKDVLTKNKVTIQSGEQNNVHLNWKSRKLTLPINETYFDELHEVFESKIEVTSLDTDCLKKAITVASKDELRPNLQHIYFGQDGMFCTDAHRMFFDLEKTVEPSFEFGIHKEIIPLLIEDSYRVILSQEVVEDKQVQGYRWVTLQGDTQSIMFKNFFEDERYVNATAVIPSGEGVGHITIPYNKETLTELKMALDVSNSTTSLGVFGENKLVASCEDHKRKFEMPLEMKLDDLLIGLNIKFVIEMLKTLKEDLHIEVHAPLKPTIVNKNWILMPILLPA